MKSLMAKNKRGVLNLTVVFEVFFLVMMLAIMGLVTIVTMSSLKNSGILASNTVEYNYSVNTMNNVSSGINTFFGSIGTVFSVLIVVVIISAILLIVVVVYRLRGSGGIGGSQGGL